MQYHFVISITNWDLIPPKTTDNESYNLQIVNETYWTMDTSTYAGFTKGMETYSQLIIYSSDSQEF